MEKLEVIGSKKLKGNIKISGSKNASLPILAATLISTKKIKIQNISSNVSKKYQSGSKVNILINPESGNIFSNENNN